MASSWLLQKWLMLVNSCHKPPSFLGIVSLYHLYIYGDWGMVYYPNWGFPNVWGYFQSSSISDFPEKNHPLLGDNIPRKPSGYAVCFGVMEMKTLWMPMKSCLTFSHWELLRQCRSLEIERTHWVELDVWRKYLMWTDQGSGRGHLPWKSPAAGHGFCLG